MGHLAFNTWVINLCGMQYALTRVTGAVPVGLYMYPRIKCDTYRSTVCISNWLEGGGGITALIMWVFFWWATLNLKHWRNSEATQPLDAKCLSLIICIRLLALLHHVDVVTDPGNMSISDTDICCLNWKKTFAIDNKVTSSFEQYKSSLCVTWRWNEWCPESFYSDDICEFRRWFEADGKFHWVV